MIKRLKHLCIGCTALLGVAFLFGNELQAQVVEDFEIRFQTQQNGGIQFLANTSLYCGTGSQCVQAQNAMPITGFPQDNNNDHNMVYFNSDDDASTWSSSSDSLSLGICAEISFAGLYWAGRLGNGFRRERSPEEIKSKSRPPTAMHTSTSSQKNPSTLTPPIRTTIAALPTSQSGPRTTR